ncbi:hypothetical protein FHS18_001212 [Paenibacillus phyllosphaerae]|uniref:Membrane protein YqhR n=1 Tax=Paenibacillus phyllosphaerae TaxID=274593 RepID=A0A7W5AUS7_9BACL|nr:YqhR family membrane protein [Paenibacillus phyllosphaerae]MBB3109160.1 hypothetical protein [Paenibacillus phyllosphaerae]
MRVSHSQQKRRRRHRTNRLMFGLNLGFFAGLIFGVGRWIVYYLQYTRVVPGFLIDSFFRISFLKTGWGQLLGLGSFIVFSIVATFLYMFLLGRFKGPWAGLIYGAVWWGGLFLVIGPLLGLVEPIRQIGYNTLSTELAVFLIWGLFIGYTYAFEFHDEASREPMMSGVGRAGAR